MSDEPSIIDKITEMNVRRHLARVLNVNPDSVVKDAKRIGMDISKPSDFGRHPTKYIYIERLSEKYAKMAARLCAASGFTSGIGGVATTIGLAGVDLVNMAARLYWLNQKLALIHGFDPESDLDNQRAYMIFMVALGIDQVTQATIRTIVTKAATANLRRRGPSSVPVIRIIMQIAKGLGVRITQVQAGKLVPVVGGLVGGGVNYWFAKSVAKQMLADYKSDYFDRWQLQARAGESG